MVDKVRFRSRQRHGKYRIEKCLLHGPYASVYGALDTIEGVKVALKIPRHDPSDKDYLSDFKRESRIAARLEHPNILPLKDASMINELFTMVTPLGVETLDSRLGRRLSTDKALDYAKQLLRAVAFAHEQGVMHCDIKPANLILFKDGRLRLADFGIAKTAFKTVRASGSGTLGYLAPEQAMGRPSFRSDVFAVGLVLHQMLCSQLFEWPFKWPSSGIKKLKQRLHPSMIDFIRRALEFRPNKRYRDGTAMLNAYLKLERSGQVCGKNKSVSARTSRKLTFTGGNNSKHWRDIQYKQFRRHYGVRLETHRHCDACHGPISEKMSVCPWCRATVTGDPAKTKYAMVCPHCERGVKKDWNYCAWCFGRGFEKESNRRFSDKRYTEKCARKSCAGPMMPFMKYCPWCHAKANQHWTIKGLAKCSKCKWGIAHDYWNYCPWCSTAVKNKR